MFWRFGGYASISSIDSILDKNDVTLEELLDESDLIQELKQHNTKLIEYLRDENVLRTLLEYVVTPQAPKPDDDGEESEEEETSHGHSLSPFRRNKDKEKSKRQEEREAWDKADKARLKYAYVACEILSSETWSILEALMEYQQHLREFWNFLKREAPLDTTEAGYFTKVNDTLLDKKTEETLTFIKSIDGIIPAMLKHVDCPMVMDLLLKMISMEKSEGGVGIVDWLQSQDLIPLLLGYLSEQYPPATQTSAGDFIKAIITISANASQNEQSCIGPNNLTRQLVSEPCIQALINEMLRGGNPLTVGVGTIIEVIRKNNSDYDPDVGAGPDIPPTSSDPIYLGTLLRYFAKHVPDFMNLILSPTHTIPSGDSTITIKRKELSVAFGEKIEPLGFDRFKTCELMAELLHCSNMGLLNERGSEAYIKERDAERDRLKAEGALAASKPPASAATEFSEGVDDFNNETSTIALGSGSPEEIRKLEIANNAEDDGFEDVGTSAELAEDIKDDLEERSQLYSDSKPAPIPNLSKEARPRLDLDEDFVDEPLTSPRLEALDEKEGELVEGLGSPEPMERDPDIQRKLEPDPTSPTSGLTTGESDLKIQKEESGEDHNVSAEPSATESKTQEPSQHNAHPDAPPLPRRNQLPETNILPPEEPPLSPHADDKPAPLFAARPDLSPQKDSEEPPESRPELGAGDSHDTIDTTLGEEGDSNRSAMMSTSDQAFVPHIENDVDGQPIVGDYLKMMFVEHKVVPTILDFFFRFPWNNFLHNVVYDVVQQVFNGPMDRGYNGNLAIDLFQTGQITERIVEGQKRSDEAQEKNNMRLGYMGHLTLIAEEVVKFSDRHPPELLSQNVLDKVTSKQWSDYVENTLSETRERDNAILGGVRPDMSVGPRQAVLNAVNAANGFNAGGSNALAQAGLNGNAGLDSMDLANNGSATSSAFGISSGGSLLSGFGSSSDEEDEEMEELEEGEGTGGAGADNLFSPSAASSDTSNSIPTIPPPLNVPPSRARCRLEQRLNRHAQNAQAQLATQVNSSDLDPSDPTNHVPILTKSPEPNYVRHHALSADETSDDEIRNPFMSPNLEDLAKDEDDAFGSFESADAFEGISFDGANDVKEKDGPKLAPPVELTARRRVFDLDDEDLEGFANSPAAEPDDSDDGDVDAEEGFEEDVGVTMTAKGS